MRHSALPCALLAALILVSNAHAAIVSNWVLSNPVQSRIYFSITFDAPPDFYTTDAAGRQADSFQYYVVYSLPYQTTFAPIIIRGGEISYNSTIVIRDGVGVDGGPHSGGWGPIRAEATYVLSGNVLTFDVPSSAIGDDDGTFWYVLEWYRYGAVLGGTRGQSEVGTVPAIESSWGRVKALYR